MTKHIVVIGAGIGGLTAGALLLKQGYRVTVLEAHVYPGGCAGTFFHKNYRFDAGATLAGGFSAVIYVIKMFHYLWKPVRRYADLCLSSPNFRNLWPGLACWRLGTSSSPISNHYSVAARYALLHPTEPP